MSPAPQDAVGSVPIDRWANEPPPTSKTSLLALSTHLELVLLLLQQRELGVDVLIDVVGHVLAVHDLGDAVHLPRVVLRQAKQWTSRRQQRGQRYREGQRRQQDLTKLSDNAGMFNMFPQSWIIVCRISREDRNSRRRKQIKRRPVRESVGTNQGLGDMSSRAKTTSTSGSSSSSSRKKNDMGKALGTTGRRGGF